MKESSKFQDILEHSSFWSQNDNNVWLASTINFWRNIEKYKFPSKLSGDRRKQIVSLVSKEILGMDSFKNPVLMKAEELTGLEKEFLGEHFLSDQSLHQAHAGEAFIIDDSGEFFTTVNLRNHIQLGIVDIRGDLENSWNRLVKVETALGKTVNYSYSSKFGFLTADPYQCGTALQVAVFLQPSGLLHTEKSDDVLEQLADESLSITGIQGSPTEIIGDVLVVKNNYSLGLTEENIIASMRTFTTKFLVEEHAARNHIKHEESALIKDKVSRAYGILIHSYQIEAVEALNAISLLKLGVELGWLTGITNIQLNQIFFNCRRAHLLNQFHGKVSSEEILHKRAEYIHKNLKDMRLVI